MFEHKKKRGKPFCPLFVGACVEDCAWRVGEQCAIAMLGRQAARQGDELYTIAEIMMGRPPLEAAPNEGGEQP